VRLRSQLGLRPGAVLTVAAVADKLKDMAVHDETGLTGDPLFKVTQVTVGEIGYRAAPGAHQVMVMSLGSPHDIASAVSRVYFAQEARLVQDVQSPVHGDQPDAGMLFARQLVKLGRCEVVVALGDGFEHGPPLRGEPVSLASEGRLHLPFGVVHPARQLKRIFNCLYITLRVRCQ
jgi:hypothetical protein